MHNTTELPLWQLKNMCPVDILNSDGEQEDGFESCPPRQMFHFSYGGVLAAALRASARCISRKMQFESGAVRRFLRARIKPSVSRGRGRQPAEFAIPTQCHGAWVNFCVLPSLQVCSTATVRLSRSALSLFCLSEHIALRFMIYCFGIIFGSLPKLYEIASALLRKEEDYLGRNRKVEGDGAGKACER